MIVIFSVWGVSGLLINGMAFMALTGNVGVGTSTYMALGNLIWIGGMVLFGIGALHQQRTEFWPQGMIGNIPYRRLLFRGVEARMAGGVVRFRSLDEMRSMLEPKKPAEG